MTTPHDSTAKTSADTLSDTSAAAPAEALAECTVFGCVFERPTVGRVLMAMLLIGVTLALAIWQVQRLEWKLGLIAELEQAQREAPLTNADLPADLAELVEKNFYPVQLRGEYLYEHEMHMIGRNRHGEPGYNLYTPLRLAEDERLVLVNRGWVPQNSKEREKRQGELRPQGEVEVDGFISVPQGASRFLPDHDVAGNVWFWPDTVRINAEKGLDLPPYAIERVEEAPALDSLPVARRSYEVQLRNDHLNYAIMWFTLTLAGVVIFITYHYRRRAS